ncbi:dTDP-4-amino-4,6-dideoxygalactose transaminase [Pseudomonas taiwanensis]|uniref:dTDP-4-amino-4,6-dideoxygalactose transaminase n=1 Tax=Pseudomonas taiwanensis TaxID=470150 RepID=UPI0015BDE4ED|nr:dTDP-4-amino-4,6-dideoxygalactose transaminase [Pseudomonas taiwanensis]NWL76377.1 dTDP-4-amino-4,6-dideoxygalactose transaminase [Pseudomonas taiwanensis]
MKVPFNRPYMTGKELWNIAQAHQMMSLAGNGAFTKKCQDWLERSTGSGKVLLTHSCTAAIEMAGLLADLQPGDEVIMPSYTFVSTANAFVLRGAKPVFVDIRPDTLNLDESLIESAITPRTRAIVPVHYAGVGCEMDRIMAIAEKHGLMVIEDAAQGILAKYKGQPLGAIGHLAAFSFHETKNLTSGEGGCLLVNRPTYAERAEILWEKGTDRSKFFRGQVDKYTWQDLGSSYLPGELTAAFLWAQLEEAGALQASRLQTWGRYHEALQPLEAQGLLRRPIVPEVCEHNAHMYYILLESNDVRNDLMAYLNEQDIKAVFHYIPLHSAPAGKRFARAVGEMSVTDHVSSVLLRLPMWTGMPEESTSRVIEEVFNYFGRPQ